MSYRYYPSSFFTYRHVRIDPYRRNMCTILGKLTTSTVYFIPDGTKHSVCSVCADVQKHVFEFFVSDIFYYFALVLIVLKKKKSIKT